MRAVLAGQHLAAIQAILGGDGPGDEVFAVGEDAPIRREAVTETLDPLLPHPRRVEAEVVVERGLVAQPVLDGASHPALGRARVTEDLRCLETGQLEHVGDVIAQPGVERRLDPGVRLEVDLVDDACVLDEPDHGGKGSAWSSSP